MSSSFFTKNHIILNEIESTNQFLLELNKTTKLNTPIVVTTDYQFLGRGRKSKKWDSERGKNLLISILFKHNINIIDQFNFSMLVSLVISDFISLYIKENISIKWPNDIMVKDKKIAGFIIDNIVSNSIIHTSVVGVGININQINFNSYSPLATSLSLENKCEYNLHEIQEKFLSCFEIRYKQHLSKYFFKEQYNNLLYLKNRFLLFESNNFKFNARIQNVDEYGNLILLLKDNKKKKFSVNEIRFLF